MKELIVKLKDDDLISGNCEKILEKYFSGVPLMLLKRIVKGNGRGRTYDPKLKSFALTLQFYSTKAYNFVRKSFEKALPHPSQVRRWYSKVTAEPGFREVSFRALRQKVSQNAHDPVICSLMLDEMAIKKHIAWDGERYRGYVDIGNNVVDDDSNPVAKDVIVFMVVSVKESWKIPIAYFFIDGLSGNERANIVKVCIRKLNDVGVKVVSLICDGPSCHFTMML